MMQLGEDQGVVLLRGRTEGPWGQGLGSTGGRGHEQGQPGLQELYWGRLLCWP